MDPRFEIRPRMTLDASSNTVGHLVEKCDAIYVAIPRTGDMVRAAGFIALKSYPSQNGIFEISKRLEIQALYVQKGSRRSGVGQFLVDRAKQYAEEGEYHQIVLYVATANLDAWSFYCDQGFSNLQSVMSWEV